MSADDIQKLTISIPSNDTDAKSTSSSSTTAQNLALGSLNAARGNSSKGLASSPQQFPAEVDPAVLARISKVLQKNSCRLTS